MSTMEPRDQSPMSRDITPCRRGAFDTYPTTARHWPLPGGMRPGRTHAWLPVGVVVERGTEPFDGRDEGRQVVLDGCRDESVIGIE